MTIDTSLNDIALSITLDRSHGGPGYQPVVVEGLPPEARGRVLWRRYPTKEEFRGAPMKWEYPDDEGEPRLVGYLPNQPPAGKLEYRLHLDLEGDIARVPEVGTVITRFKGAVPSAVLIPHIILMFVGMLFSNRTGIEAIRRGKRLKTYAWVTAVLLILGGMILGPIVQKAAFGALWTGVPFGYDLTDNKTLIAVVGWIAALVALRKSRHAHWWVLGAALLTFVIFMIPHSLLGSELKHE